MESGIARVPVWGFRPTFRPNLNLPIATETSAVEFYEAAVLVDTGNALCEYLGVCMHSDYNANLLLLGNLFWLMGLHLGTHGYCT